MRALVFAAAVVWGLTGCEGTTTAADADAASATGADGSTGDAAGRDPDCPPRELFLEIGQGEEYYTALGEGRSPRLFEGPQGGQHMAIALRVQSTGADHLETLTAGVVVTSWTPVDCSEGSNTEEGGCVFPLGERQVTFGSGAGELPLQPGERGITDAVGLYVPVNWWPDAHERRIDAWIETTCDEQPTARHVVPPANRPF